MDEPSLWVAFELENTTDASLTIEGFRGAAPPKVSAADGVLITAMASQTRLENGGGGWGPGAFEGAYINPGGIVHAAFGLRAGDGQDVSALLPLTITWQPVGTVPAAFEIR